MRRILAGRSMILRADEAMGHSMSGCHTASRRDDDRPQRRSASRRWRSASMRSASRRRAGAGSARASRGIPGARLSRRHGLARRDARTGAASPRCCGPRRRASSCSASITRPRTTRSPFWPARNAARISVYARNRDYHDLIKSRLKALARWIAAALARRAQGLRRHRAGDGEAAGAGAPGIGWQGKHTNLVSRDFGSWLFLGEIYLTLDLAPDAAEDDHCGACRALPRCLPDRAPSRRPTGSMRGAASPI